MYRIAFTLAQRIPASTSRARMLKSSACKFLKESEGAVGIAAHITAGTMENFATCEAAPAPRVVGALKT